ncbi:MAG: phosphoribosylamine--glycine ligase [Rhizobiales bacterium]|nr:phosphoribosylamine--glycine ligase [Hyphomicrobiales bacterium]MBI3673500.1 phosphoribosylamine--glycine ligase [Hyphomicrobiales bacterium]
MNILLIGSGGREHALAWAIGASSLCDRLYCAPGNPGIAAICHAVDLKDADHAAVIAFCKTWAIGLVVIGPEAPLVAGLADDLRAAGIKVFGPSKFAAQLEGSKGFTKDICAKYDIPTAAYGRFRERSAALAYLARHGAPIVVKADGLAAGKGVTVAMTPAEAQAAVNDIFTGRFGDAECVIEEYLEGEEASFFVLTDGTHALPLATAQDHKRLGDGDVGPNTGGMGAYSPAPCMTEALCTEALETIVKPTIRALADMGHPYVGVLYAGLMLTRDGPKLIEYNARFGDPECQVLMLRLKDDIVPLLLACVDGTLDKMSVRWLDEVALTVVMFAKGYPGETVKGTEIRGLDAAGAGEGVEIFHAGTALENGRLVAAGGRVLNVTALGKTVKEAQARAYAAVDRIDWPDGFCRRDIGWRAA